MNNFKKIKYAAIYIIVFLGAIQVIAKPKKIKVQVVNNLILIPVKLNGYDLTFLLDTGVNKTILFNVDPSIFNYKTSPETSMLMGLGSQNQHESKRFFGNRLEIEDIVIDDLDVFLINNSIINFTPRLGHHVDGVIGYDFLKEYTVEINYTSKYIKCFEGYESKRLKLDKYVPFNLEFHNNKPYLDVKVMMDDFLTSVKMLIDTGGSESVWLIERPELNILAPKTNFFEDYLGLGLSGSIYGKRTYMKSIHFKSFRLNQVTASFPDSLYIKKASAVKDRGGSVSGEILKRFNMVIDYKNKTLYLKKNINFNKPFNYNKSGLIVEQHGLRIEKQMINSGKFNSSLESNNRFKEESLSYFQLVLTPSFRVVSVIQDSPAYHAGLKTGDVIMSINGKYASGLSLQGINHFFYAEGQKKIKLIVDRYGEFLNFSFKLRDPIKKAS